MSSSELVEAYMAIKDRNPDIDSGGGYAADLSDAEMNQVYNSAGGEAEYNKLTAWAAQNVSETKLDAFNDMIDKGNALLFKLQSLDYELNMKLKKVTKVECLQVKLQELRMDSGVKLKLYKLCLTLVMIMTLPIVRIYTIN